jgi:cobalt/nickel transport system permease protein
MHIPDGYLSPSTCATLYVGAAPFWYVALHRVKKELDTRTIPLLSLFSAFSFVIMMFNLPLPGGTTGHAVGMGMASIVLGPWVSMLGLSIALLIQALFFGDGGITALGANCFNMAIVGSLVAFAVYRLLSHGADITAPRRVFAAAVAGYTAINVAAFCAAVEFGVQPLLFRDLSGAPLYAPYPLRVSIPAMMIGHLTFAGLAELVLSAGVVGYFQRADPAMLQLTAPGAPYTMLRERNVESYLKRPSTRRLWLGLGLLLALSPLGIVAVGRAWGEWHASEFSDPTVRRQITAASGNQPPPVHAPTALQRLSSIWKAPISDYAPSFIDSRSFGYFISGLVGVGLIFLFSLSVRCFLFRAPPKSSAAAENNWMKARRKSRTSFLETTIAGLLNAMEEAVFAEELAKAKGFLQALDPRVKLVGLGALIVGAVTVHRLLVLFALFAIAVLLALSSKISLGLLATRMWIPVFAFTGVIAVPALFLIPGQPLFRIPLLALPVTLQGVTSAGFLTLRAETTATLSLLLVLSTSWNQLLRALRFFRVPITIVVIIETTYRFVFLLLMTTRNMLESRSARRVGRLDSTEQRRFAAASVGVLLDKILQFSNEVHAAMRARGFRGEAMLLDDSRMRQQDWVQLVMFLGLACIALWLGR